MHGVMLVMLFYKVFVQHLNQVGSSDKKRRAIDWIALLVEIMEVGSGFEPLYEVLQTSA